MSLRAFHVFFLVVAILFDLGLLAYAFYAPDDEVTRELRSVGVGLGVVAMLLVTYAIWFVRKKGPTIII
jgi:ABC-type cobalamin transport system permease subunit